MEVNPGTGGAAAPPAWFSALEQPEQEQITKRGWDKLEPGLAALESFKSLRELQKMHGGLTAGTTVAIPQPGADGLTDPEKVKAFWTKLGAPADAAGYDLSKVTHSDGRTLDGNYVDAVKKAAVAANIPAGLLGDFVKGMVPHLELAERDARMARETQLANSKAALEAEWGANAPKNKYIATQALNTLSQMGTGFTPEALAAFEQGNPEGYGIVMKMLVGLGNLMGEGRFVPSGGQVADTVESLTAELEALKNDSGWVSRFASGDVAAVKKHRELIAALHRAQQGR